MAALWNDLGVLYNISQDRHDPNKPLNQEPWPLARRMALEVGIARNYYEIVELLLGSGAAVFRCRWSTQADPALLRAVACGDMVATSAILLQTGIEPHWNDDYLQVAIGQANEGMIALLSKYGPHGAQPSRKQGSLRRLLSLQRSRRVRLRSVRLARMPWKGRRGPCPCTMNTDCKHRISRILRQYEMARAVYGISLEE